MLRCKMHPDRTFWEKKVKISNYERERERERGRERERDREREIMPSIMASLLTLLALGPISIKS